jgi:predicted ribosome quality control (RQC) complex YloA/Tae2 family protein
MAAGERRGGPPAPPDPEAGSWHGRSVARRFVSPDGMTVLVGRTAADNDILTLHLAAPRDFWLHVAADSGSHVVVRNPAGLDRLPRETERFAAALAAGYSKLRHGGRVAVHVATRADVSKPRGLPPGKVMLHRYRTVQAAPSRSEGVSGEEGGAG